MNRPAIVVTNGWAGLVSHPVEVIGETPERYRVRFLRPFRGARPGSELTVPKHCVTFTDEARP